MTYPNNPQPSRPRLSIQAVTGLSMLALIVLFFGIAVISAKVRDSERRAALAVSSSPQPIVRPTTIPTTPGPSVTPTPSLPETPASPKHTTSALRTTKPAPARTTQSVRHGVHQGTYCTPQGARGVTVAGTPMVCTTTAADERKRWRKA